MAYGYFKNLARRTASDKFLRNKAFNIAKNPKFDRYQRGLASMVYKYFQKKSKGSVVNIGVKLNEQLSEELHKPNFKKIKVQLKGFRFSLCVIDIFSKYAWVVPLKDKKGVSIVDAFQKILDDSNRKPSKIWVDKGSKFYNSSFKKMLKR